MEPVPVPDPERNLEIQVLARWAVLEFNVKNLSSPPLLRSDVKYVRVLNATKQQLLPSVIFTITLKAVRDYPPIVGIPPVGILPPELEYLAEIAADPLDNKLELLQFLEANRDAPLPVTV